MPTTVGFVINVEPHYHEATFDGDYQDITAKDILDVAPKVCMEFYRQQTSGLPPPRELARQETYRLHYIVEEATAFNLHRAHEAGYDIRPNQRVDPDVFKQALSWYRTTGHYLTSEHLESTSKLASKASSPDPTVVRWYVVVPAIVTFTERHPLIYKEGFLLRRRNDYIDMMVGILAQSDSYASTLLSKDQKSKAAPTKYNLALVQSKIPISDIGRPELFEPAFAYAYTMDRHRKEVVVEERTDSDEPDYRHPILALGRLVTVGWGRVHETEMERSKAIFRILGELFDDSGADEFTGECVTAHGLPALYVIQGADGDIPRDAGSPHERGMLTYQRKIASNRYKAVREMTCCPCLVIVREKGETKLTVSMAYLTDTVHGAELFRIYLPTGDMYAGTRRCPIIFMSGGDMEREDATVSLQILRNTAQMLRDSYAKVHTGSTLPHTPHLFPRPASIINLLPSATPASIASLAALNLTITDQVPMMHPIPTLGGRRLTHFRGAVQNPANGIYSPVYVKITGRGYGEAAHRLLADHDPPLAPQLLYCDKVAQGFTMIVMEDLQGDTLDTLVGTLVSQTDEIVTAIDRDIERAVGLLHANNMVHGDIRASHVVAQRSTEREDGTTRAFLLKFDYAGEEGAAKYPPLHRMDCDVEWIAPAEQLHCLPIKKDHDVGMLAKLRDSIVRRDSFVWRAQAGDRRLVKRLILGPVVAGGVAGLCLLDFDGNDEIQM